MVNDFLRRLALLGRDRRGSVTVISAFVLPALIGVVALVGEFGHGLLMRSENQRVADLAAYAGATAYSSSGSTSSMNAAISNVAALNGLPSSAIIGQLAASPSGDGNQAVTATVATAQLLLLAPVLGSGRSITVSSSASAEIAAQVTGCVFALSSSGSGVTLSGGTTLTTSTCSVSSNAAVSVPCGTYITTKAVNYNSAAAPSQPCNGIQPPAGTTSVRILKTVTADPLSGNAGVAAATGRLSTVTGYSNPTIPTAASGPNLTFDYGSSAISAVASAGCTAAFSSPTWTVTCPNGGSYKFGSISLGGGITVNFNTGGSASTTYSFNGAISSSGTALNFGPGTYTIAGGLTTGGGSTTSFGAGTFNIGTNSSCTYSICNTSTLTFGGPSSFVLTAGISNTGGSTLTMGTGTTNSYQIGSGSSGNSFYLGGGSLTKLADATGTTFKVVGNVNVTSGGGSCFQIPAAAQHDIKGSLSTAGGTILGSGPYTTTGYVALGGNGGGDVTCWGSTVGLSGAGVTLTIGASTTPSSGSCSGQAFCSAAGYGHVTLTAPTSGTLASLVVIGPIPTSNTKGATFSEGSSNTSLSGAFYFPNGAITLGGGASVGNGAGQCLQFVGSQITLSGGTALASTCIGSASAAQAAMLIR